jgi:hypothetical protein
MSSFFNFFQISMKQLTEAWCQSDLKGRIVAVSYWIIVIPNLMRFFLQPFDILTQHNNYLMNLFQGVIFMSCYLAGLFRLQNSKVKVLFPHQRTLWTLACSYVLLQALYCNPLSGTLILFSLGILALSLISNFVQDNRLFFLYSVFTSAFFSAIIGQQIGWILIFLVSCLGIISYVFPNIEVYVEISQHVLLMTINAVYLFGNTSGPDPNTIGSFMYLLPSFVLTFANLVFIGGETSLQHLIKHAVFFVSWVYMYPLLQSKYVIVYVGFLILFLGGTVSTETIEESYLPLHRNELITNLSAILLGPFMFKNGSDIQFLFYYMLHIGNAFVLFLGDMQNSVYDEINLLKRPFTKQSLTVFLTSSLVLVLISSFYYGWNIIAVAAIVVLFSVISITQWIKKIVG